MDQNKKQYVAPAMHVVIVDTKQALLCASGNDNPYWNGCWEDSDDGYWSEK